jgi:hypothetical protein
MNISRCAVALFQQLHEMSLLAIEVCGDEVAAMKPHFDMCERLSQVSFIVSKRLAIQKAFRKALGQIKYPTESITAALGTAYEERERLSKLINPQSRRFVSGSLDNDPIVSAWINYSGFLVALGGCWYYRHAPESGWKLSDSLRQSEFDSKSRLRAFLKDQCRYLAADWSILREMVCRMLSSDISPRLYGLLFEQLEEVTGRLFDTKGQPVCKDSNTLFVDQAVTLLKGLIDRIAEQPTDMPLHTDFGGILQAFCEYLERLGRDPVKLQIKVKMCGLCELVAAKRDFLSLKQETRLMNNLLTYVHRWAVESNASKEPDRNLQRYALRAMANITEYLPLFTPADPDSDPNEAKGKLFKSYFDYFASILKKCRLYDEFDKDRRTHVNVNKDLAALLIKSKEQVKDLAPLRDLTITTISNLLNANFTAALPYCLSMAYDEDDRTRTAFLQLFAKVLQQRVELEESDDILPMERNERIVDVLLVPV